MTRTGVRVPAWYAIRVAVALAILAVAVGALWAATPLPPAEQPHPDAHVYADMAIQITRGHGFRTRIDERLTFEQQRPGARLYATRYAPGFPLALTPFVALGTGTPADGARGARVIAVAALSVVFVAGYLLAGPEGAAIAALVSWASPFFERSARLVMSDAFGALLSVAIVICLLAAGAASRPRRGRDAFVVLAGFCGGFAVLSRVSAVFVLVALAAAVTTWRQRMLAMLGALPLLVVLAGYQWAYFGHPLRSGYAQFLPGVKLFDPSYATTPNLRGDRRFVFDDKLDGLLMQWTCPCDGQGPMGKAPNVVFYPAVLLGLYWIYFPPLLPLLGLVELYRRRRTTAARYAGFVVVGNVALMVPYLFQCARFVAPAALVLLVYSSAGMARLGGLIRNAPSRGDT